MSDLAPFVAAAIRDKVVTDLQEENKKLKEENKGLREEVSRLTELRDAFSQHPQGPWYLISVTGPRGYPLYSTGNDIRLPQPQMDLEHYDNGHFCHTIAALFNAAVQINSETYRVVDAARIHCANVAHNFQERGNDLIYLDISFGKIHLIATFEVSSSNTHIWNQLDFVPLQNMRLVLRLCGCSLANEDEYVAFLWVRFDNDWE